MFPFILKSHCSLGSWLAVDAVCLGQGIGNKGGDKAACSREGAKESCSR